MVPDGPCSIVKVSRFHTRIHMKHFGALLTFLITVLMSSHPGHAQLVPVKHQIEFYDSIKKDFEYGPYFGLYKDNYFTAGTSTLHKPTGLNSDVKFQISLGIRLTGEILPGKSFLFLQYTQKTFWNVFQESMPMRDINFNPGIGWSRPFFSKNRFVGQFTLMVEHESNGRDGDSSRSWNKVSFLGSVMVNDWLMVHAKYWIPIVDGENNKDILKYCGIFQQGVVVTSNNKRWTVGLTWVKRSGWNFNMNTIWEVSFRPSMKSPLNFFMQYYNGYGENLLDYKQFHSRLRAGICFKPKFFSQF